MLGIGLPRQVGPSQQPMQGHWQAHTLLPSYAVTEGPALSPQGTDIAVGLARCHVMHTLKQNRGHNDSETGRDVPILGDGSRRGCEDAAFLVRTCLRPIAHSYVSEQGWKAYVPEAALPNRAVHFDPVQPHPAL